MSPQCDNVCHSTEIAIGYARVCNWMRLIAIGEPALVPVAVDGCLWPRTAFDPRACVEQGVSKRPGRREGGISA